MEHQSYNTQFPASLDSSGLDVAKAQSLVKALIHSSNEGIVTLDRFGRVEDLNQIAVKLLQVDPGLVRGKLISDIFDAIDALSNGPINLADPQYLQPQLAPVKARLRSRNGPSQPIRFQLRAFSDPVQPELSGAVLYLNDDRVSESTEAQFRLIATALKSIGEGVIITDRNWGDADPSILYVNDGFTETTGYRDLDVIGRGLSVLLGKNTDSAIIDEMIPNILSGQTAAGEMVGYRKNGAEFIMSWKVFPVFNAAEQVSNYVVIQRDVSQIRSLERDLFQSQKMEAVGRLAGGIAHDFNNILAVILSFSDLILDRDPAEEHAKYLREIRKAAERATDLTQQLLSFSRRNKDLKPEVLDGIKVTRDLQMILRRLIPENIAFHAEYCQDAVHVNINRTALEQILINLVTNARDALQNGGTISLKLADCGEEDAARYLPEHIESQPYMVLSVHDDGDGIDPETQKRIFEPFFTTKDVGKGTGLGLATVYGIVKQANGHIELHSAAGQGTLFQIFLPTVEPKAADRQHYEGKPLVNFTSTERETIVVVEDDETMCDCISGLLVYHNYDVYSFNQGEDAVEFLDGSDVTVRLLLTDVILPKMRGTELSTQLHERYPNMQTVFMTGYPEEILAQFDVPEDATVLKKPFSLKGALTTVREKLSRSNVLT